MVTTTDFRTPSADELEQIVYGRTLPRVYTPPLRDVDNDESATLGFDVIDFAAAIGFTLYPWQEWWLKHALELKLDGTLRFSTVLTLISRQNGKTFLLKIIALYFLYRRKVRLVMGVAQDLTTARESLMGALEAAEDDEGLRSEFIRNPRGRDGYEAGSGREVIKLTGRRRYMIKAATGKGGRGLSVNVLILDELREWRDALAWAALSKTVIAKPGALTLAISNAGDDNSIILNNLHAAALGSNDRIAIFEWSAPPHITCTCGRPGDEGEHGHDSKGNRCLLLDIDAMAQANPSLGYPGAIALTGLLDGLSTDPTNVFRTECLCQRVVSIDALFSESSWRNCSRPGMNLTAVRRRVALCLDVAPDGQHATLIAAAMRFERDPPDPSDPASLGEITKEVALLEVIQAWRADQMATLARDLRAQATKIKPAIFGWFPAGPAAAYGQALKGLRKSEEITAAAAACQALLTVVETQTLEHPNDDLLNAHVLSTKKLPQGDGWRFVRIGTGHCDAAYAAAGAVYLAQSLPKTEPGSGTWVV